MLIKFLVSDKLEKIREDLSKATSEVTCMDFEIMKKESTCRKMLEEGMLFYVLCCI